MKVVWNYLRSNGQLLRSFTGAAPNPGAALEALPQAAKAQGVNETRVTVSFNDGPAVEYTKGPIR
jgi:hypothetical protein